MKNGTTTTDSYNRKKVVVATDGDAGRQRQWDGEGRGGGADLAGGAVHLQPPPSHATIFSCPGTTPSFPDAKMVFDDNMMLGF